MLRGKERNLPAIHSYCALLFHAREGSWVNNGKRYYAEGPHRLRSFLYLGKMCRNPESSCLSSREFDGSTRRGSIRLLMSCTEISMQLIFRTDATDNRTEDFSIQHKLCNFNACEKKTPSGDFNGYLGPFVHKLCTFTIL